MKREQLIDYVYLRLSPEQKQEVRDELLEDFVRTFNVLQLMEKRASGELNERNYTIMEEEINALNTKGRSTRHNIQIAIPKLHRTGRGGKIDDSASTILCENRELMWPIDILKAYLLDEE